MVSHLEHGLHDSKNDVLFVGYQAHGTPGRDLLKYGKRPDGYVCFNGHKTPINANIHQLPGYSAHADQTGLLDFVHSMPEKPGAIKLVHGEAEAQNKMKSNLNQSGYHVL